MDYEMKTLYFGLSKMPKCNKSNFNHVLYNYNRARVKSNMKDKKPVDDKISLLKRKETEGDTKRIQNAMMKVDAKLKAMGISDAMVQAAMDRKGVLSK